MAEYLASVIAAQHLVGRNFAFVAGVPCLSPAARNATPHPRWAWHVVA